MLQAADHLFLTLATVLTVSQMFGALSRAWLSVRWTRIVFLSNLGQVAALAVVGYFHWGAGDPNLNTSALMRAFALALWSLVVATSAARSPTSLARRALGLLGVISFGCLVCLLLPSEPWSVLPPLSESGTWSAEPHGRGDLYRLALYAGSAGFAVPFATAIAAMFENDTDTSWAQHAIGWALAVCAWLSVAVALAIGLPAYPWRFAPVETWGSVESVALVEWLASVLLLYSLLLTARRGTGGGWALLLATVIFPTTFLGILLVPIRISAGTVYPYALEPVGDLLTLVLMRILLGGALMLYAWKLVMRGAV
jgi:cytochrome c-type biogenesis protein CcmF